MHNVKRQCGGDGGNSESVLAHTVPNTIITTIVYYSEESVVNSHCTLELVSRHSSNYIFTSACNGGGGGYQINTHM